MSNGMAALSREDTTPQSLTDTHCSINAANIEERKTWDAKWILHLAEFHYGARMCGPDLP